MQLQNICTKKEYEKDGEKKVQWFKIGILKTAESGRKYIKLFHQPQTEFSFLTMMTRKKVLKPVINSNNFFIYENNTGSKCDFRCSFKKS